MVVAALTASTSPQASRGRAPQRRSPIKLVTRALLSLHTSRRQAEAIGSVERSEHIRKRKHHAHRRNTYF